MNINRRGPAPAWCSPAWWEVYAPRIDHPWNTGPWAHQLAMAYQIIRDPESLSPGEYADQTYMVEHLTGRTFHPTTPQ